MFGRGMFGNLSNLRDKIQGAGMGYYRGPEIGMGTNYGMQQHGGMGMRAMGGQGLQMPDTTGLFMPRPRKGFLNDPRLMAGLGLMDQAQSGAPQWMGMLQSIRALKEAGLFGGGF